MPKKKLTPMRKALLQIALPLSIATALCLMLYTLRVLISGSWQFWFLNWNLVLAWVPVLLSSALVISLRTRRWLSWQNLGLTAAWLIFLPNTFYLLTDFVHLGDYDQITLLFDIVLFLTYALTGVALGWISVYMVHGELKKRKPRDTRWLLLLLVFLLCSFAMYIGRNLGWNSWDILLNPDGIIMDTTQRLAYPDRYAETYSITALFFVFITISYLAFYTTIKGLSTHK
jgi:uncharacterized membrane protein